VAGGKCQGHVEAYHRYQLLAAAVTQVVELADEEDDEAVEFELEAELAAEVEVEVVATQLPRHEPMLHGCCKAANCATVFV